MAIPDYCSIPSVTCMQTSGKKRKQGREREDAFPGLKTENVAKFIFSFLNHQELACCARVCKKWERLVFAADSLWSDLMDRTYHIFQCSFKVSAKMYFQSLAVDLKSINQSKFSITFQPIPFGNVVTSKKFQDRIFFVVKTKDENYCYYLMLIKEKTTVLFFVAPMLSNYDIYNKHICIATDSSWRCYDVNGRLENVIPSHDKLILNTNKSPYLLISNEGRIGMMQISPYCRVANIESSHLNDFEMIDRWVIFRQGNEISIHDANTSACEDRFVLNGKVIQIHSDENKIIFFYVSDEEDSGPKLLIWEKGNRVHIQDPFKGLGSPKEDEEWSFESFIHHHKLVITVDHKVKVISYDCVFSDENQKCPVDILPGKYSSYFDHYLVLQGNQEIENEILPCWKIWDLETRSWAMTLELPYKEDFIPICFLKAGPFLIVGTDGGYVCFFNRFGERLAYFRADDHPANLFYTQGHLVILPFEGSTVIILPLNSLAHLT